MGVYTEIELSRPEGGSFTAGNDVSGVVKYEVDKETVFKKITLSLHGTGKFKITDDDDFTYRNSEEYVKIENVVQHNPLKVPIGKYEIPFNFTLPRNIPPSLKYSKIDKSNLKCDINYYIAVKFYKSSLVEEKAEIAVESGIKPRWPMEPTILGEKKKLFRLFSSTPNVVNIKTTVQSCVIAPGGKVQLNIEVVNNTNLILKGVEMILVEIHTFTAMTQHKIKRSVDMETYSKFGTIAIGATMNTDLTLDLPKTAVSLDYSNIVSRDYFVVIKTKIPFPHHNAVLEIPLQIGYI